jgi:hypothetical protein
VLQTESAAEWFSAPQSEVLQALEEIAFEAHEGQQEQTGVADLPEERLAERAVGIRGGSADQGAVGAGGSAHGWPDLPHTHAVVSPDPHLTNTLAAKRP